MTRSRYPVLAVTALCCSVAPEPAHSVYLNPRGLGQALVFPYYTVNDDLSTVITMVNTTNRGKAVKVRFLEGQNSRDVFDVNVYLSPYDVWTAQLLPLGTGAGIFSNDNSCTVPKLPTSSKAMLAFSTSAFDGSTAQGKDGGPVDASRTREGHVEIIEMGELDNSLHGSLDATKHGGGVPLNCQQLVDAWGSQGYWTLTPAADMLPATGGLTGTGTIVNVGLGTVEGYVPDALGQFYAANTAALNTAPDALQPNLASATSLTSTTYPDNANLPVTSTFARGIDAVSSLFMASTLINEYWTSGSAAANSEWVVTFPTKRFYTDPYYVPTAQPPFDARFTSSPAGGIPGTSCSSEYASDFRDREEGNSSLPGGAGFGSLPPPFVLCFASQVLAFNQWDATTQPVTSVLAARLSPLRLHTGFNNGWVSLDLTYAINNYFNNHFLATQDNKKFLGQPVTGFMVTQFVNGNLGGALANYTALYKHRSTVYCVTSTDPQSNCN